MRFGSAASPPVEIVGAFSTPLDNMLDSALLFVAAVCFIAAVDGVVDEALGGFIWVSVGLAGLEVGLDGLGGHFGFAVASGAFAVLGIEVESVGKGAFNAACYCSPKVFGVLAEGCPAKLVVVHGEVCVHAFMDGFEHFLAGSVVISSCIVAVHVCSGIGYLYGDHFTKS